MPENPHVTIDARAPNGRFYCLVSGERSRLGELFDEALHQLELKLKENTVYTIEDHDFIISFLSE